MTSDFRTPYEGTGFWVQTNFAIGNTGEITQRLELAPLD